MVRHFKSKEAYRKFNVVPDGVVTELIVPFELYTAVEPAGIFVVCTGCVIGFVPELLAGLELEDEGGL